MLAVEFSGVNLYRRTQEEFSYDFKGMVIHAMRGNYRRPARRHVIRSVDLAIDRGEKVGLVGANGSGKSTMLKLATGILTPTNGRVAVRGRVAPLIELGAGFEPELSVEENIVFYGVLLGFSRSYMNERVRPILDFAELADRAHEPLKTLSSGMNARLAFAIATDSHPDVLLLDEVLAVGDERFRAKSAARIQDLWKEHVTIIVVSHELPFLAQSCDRLVWLRDGTIVADGVPSDVIAAYLDSIALASPQLMGS